MHGRCLFISHRLQMLDAIRYMVVYNPLIFLVFSLLAHLAPHHTVHRCAAKQQLCGRLLYEPRFVAAFCN